MVPLVRGGVAGRCGGRVWLRTSTSGKPLASPAGSAPQWVQQRGNGVEVVDLLVISGVLLLAPTLVFGSVYLWSKDPGRRDRAWQLLRLLQRAKRWTS